MWEEAAWLDPTTAKVISGEAQVTGPEGTKGRGRDGTGSLEQRHRSWGPEATMLGTMGEAHRHVESKGQKDEWGGVSRRPGWGGGAEWRGEID